MRCCLLIYSVVALTSNTWSERNLSAQEAPKPVVIPDRPVRVDTNGNPTPPLVIEPPRLTRFPSQISGTPGISRYSELIGPDGRVINGAAPADRMHYHDCQQCHVSSDSGNVGTLEPYRNWLRIGRDSQPGVDNVTGYSQAITPTPPFGVSTGRPDPVMKSMLKITDQALVINDRCEWQTKNWKLQQHDVVLEIDGKPIESAAMFIESLQRSRDAEVEFLVLRGGKKQSVQQATRADSRSRRSYLLGITLSEMAPALRSQLGFDEIGVVVKSVLDGGPAAEAGIQQYDVLLQADDQALTESNDLIDAVTKSQGETMSLKIWRSGEESTIEVTPRLLEQVLPQEASRPTGSSVPPTAGSVQPAKPSVATDWPVPYYAPVPVRSPVTESLQLELRELREQIKILTDVIRKLESRLPKAGSGES